MAYAAVASLIHTIDLILNYHQHSISPQFKNEIISLQKYTNFLEWFLENYPHRANNWEETIWKVTDRAEEVVERLLSDSLMEFELDSDFDELKSVTNEIKSIVETLMSGGRFEAADRSDDVELMEIISRLRGGSSSLETIAIFGMGGMGKTTLARNAFINQLIASHFEIRAWYTKSSEEFTMKEMMLALLRSLHRSGYGNESNTEEELIDRVYRIFKGKRYLIVLDDIRSLGDLEKLNKVLPDDRNGSRIILTTRSVELAETVGSHVHEMDFLDVDKSWKLFREKIFKGDPCPSRLESIGKEIARSCRGHPLSIDVVSGILAADQTEATWEDILKDMNTTSENVDARLFEVLSLSYTYLPHHLRPCFLYLALFPADHEIRVSMLIKLWTAEGFLKESECKSFEEMAEEHVEDLVQRGLVSVTSKKSNGRIKYMTINDLMQTVCRLQAQVDNFILQKFNNLYDREGMTMELQSCRRVSDLNYHDDILEGVYGSTIRTIIGFSPYKQLCSRLSVENVRLLRILHLSKANYDALAEEVFELFHLRYLAFSCEFSISEAISNLENLQTLIICPRENDGELPEGIWRMRQLRHLIVLLLKLPSPKGATAPLENLQTLSLVVNFVCSTENLKVIPYLKKLGIFYTHSRDVVEDYELHNLICLRKLEILKIVMVSCSVEDYKMSLSAFQFPPTLKKLNLSGLELPWEDMKIVASLPNLQVLKLRNNACIGGKWETSEGGFSQLTYLLIHECNLENWIAESSHFPRLERLVLSCCSHLLKVPNDIGKIPTLNLIILEEPNHSLLCSAKQIQEDLLSSGDDRLRVFVV